MKQFYTYYIRLIDITVVQKVSLQQCAKIMIWIMNLVFCQVLWVVVNLQYSNLNNILSIQYYSDNKEFFLLILCKMWPVFLRICFTLGFWYYSGAQTSIQFLRPEEWHVPLRFDPYFREKVDGLWVETQRLACATFRLSSSSAGAYSLARFALLLYNIVFPMQVITPQSLRLTQPTHCTHHSFERFRKMPLIFKM